MEMLDIPPSQLDSFFNAYLVERGTFDSSYRPLNFFWDISIILWGLAINSETHTINSKTILKSPLREDGAMVKGKLGSSTPRPGFEL
jgi:hypothetical protein